MRPSILKVSSVLFETNLRATDLHHSAVVGSICGCIKLDGGLSEYGCRYVIAASLRSTEQYEYL